MGNNLKVVWADFSTLSLAVFVLSVIEWNTKARLHLELKTRSRFSLMMPKFDVDVEALTSVN
jgi:hypothetical protein